VGRPQQVALVFDRNINSRTPGAIRTKVITRSSTLHTPPAKPPTTYAVFKVHFGLLTLKAYTKGEHVLRFEAVVHNTRQLRCGRILERFPDIVARLHAMVDRFLTTLDCVDIGFVPDGVLETLAAPSKVGATRLGGIDLSKPRTRAVLAAAVALSVTPDGFTVADLAAKVNAMTGTDYTIEGVPLFVGFR